MSMYQHSSLISVWASHSRVFQNGRPLTDPSSDMSSNVDTLGATPLSFFLFLAVSIYLSLFLSFDLSLRPGGLSDPPGLTNRPPAPLTDKCLGTGGRSHSRVFLSLTTF